MWDFTLIWLFGCGKTDNVFDTIRQIIEKLNMEHLYDHLDVIKWLQL